MAKSVYLVPFGTRNLQALFPALPWSEIVNYYLTVTEDGSPTVLATTPTVQVEGCEDDLKISFLTYLGHIDTLIFKKTDQQHEVKSEHFYKGVSTVTNHNISRNSIVANDVFSGTLYIREEDVNYYDEILDSPIAWLQGEDDFIPIVILDKKSIKHKIEDRYEYEIIVDFKYSHERIIPRI
jgi:hypothetical protein